MAKTYFHPETGQKISRQRWHQIMNVQLGLCRVCGEPRLKKGTYCPACAVKRRERERRKFGRKKRYLRCPSYLPGKVCHA